MSCFALSRRRFFFLSSLRNSRASRLRSVFWSLLPLQFLNAAVQCGARSLVRRRSSGLPTGRGLSGGGATGERERLLSAGRAGPGRGALSGGGSGGGRHGSSGRAEAVACETCWLGGAAEMELELRKRPTQGLACAASSGREATEFSALSRMPSVSGTAKWNNHPIGIVRRLGQTCCNSSSEG